MAAFDTAITPTASSPANTSQATLFTASADTAVLVDVANIGTGTIAVNVGINPGGGVHWKVFEQNIEAGGALASLGPYVIQSGDTIEIQTDTADDATFSVSGLESS